MGFLSSAFGVGDAKDAADAQAQGYKDAEATYRAAQDQALAGYSPYTRIGEMGANAIADVYNTGTFDAFRADPGYKFAFDEGMRAVDSSGAARGLSLSGAQLKGLNRYGTGVADQTYGNWFNRNMGLANLGKGTADSKSNVLMNSANGIANMQTGGAAAKASGYMANANFKNYLASSLHESGQRIGEAWATMGMGGGGGGGSTRGTGGTGGGYTMPFNQFSNQYSGGFGGF